MLVAACMTERVGDILYRLSRRAINSESVTTFKVVSPIWPAGDCTAADAFFCSVLLLRVTFLERSALTMGFTGGLVGVVSEVTAALFFSGLSFGMYFCRLMESRTCLNFHR